MTHLMQAHRQWAKRPHDQRFLSLIELADFVGQQQSRSRSSIVSSRRLRAVLDESDPRGGLMIEGPSGPAAPTHWSFGQIASLVGAPANYLREMPAPIVADCLNYGLRFARDIEEVGLLLTEKGADASELRAATGPRYGRVWNAEVADALVQRFGDGVNGDWRVPGEFGKEVPVSGDNTTLFASDRDLFVFLADESNRIEVPNRRGGQSGTLARGFFVWNSEVGATTLGAGFFLFDYVCCNRIVWGARDYNEVRIRHTSGAPDRWLEEVEAVLVEYANGSVKPVLETIEAAQERRLDDVDRFLNERFGKKLVADIKAIHEIEEQRPIETLWDATTAITAYARTVPHSDRRIELEREAGRVMQLAA